MIVLRNIWFSYVDENYVLKNINIEFSRGITVVLGPNGSGKTTLLKIASCLYKPIRGEVLIDDINYWNLNEEEKIRFRRKIVYVHEKPILLRGSVLDNIIYGLIIRGYSRDEAIKKAHKISKELNITSILSRRTETLSIGERRLVTLARALVLDTDYLLLDDPIAHLHPSTRELVVDIVRSMKDEKVIAIATHDPLSTLKIASKVIILDSGRIVNISEPRNIIDKYILEY
ncbi:MAG: ABC transporter ATP-binding protein [Thermoprotei archaeon]|nr:MAG: ABC transporter ATP-binding protein [Thermoprotei archaeon]